MKVTLTREQILRPLGSDLSDEAKRFFSRVGPVSFYGRSDKPIDFAALNRDLDKADHRAHEMVMARARGGRP